MQTPQKITNDRRRTGGQLTDAQFREFILISFEEGDKRFLDLHKKIDTYFGNMSDAIGENTIVTRQAADLAAKAVTIAEKTQKDTEGLVKFYQFGEKTVDAVSTGTKRASRASRLLLPIIVMITVIGMVWHGEPLRWKDVLEAALK